MSEEKEKEKEKENPAKPQEKKWTEWSVVNTGDGTYRCKRTNVADGKDAEYRPVPQPVFSKPELMAMIDFGLSGLLASDDIVLSVYDRRYRQIAFRLCGELNATPSGAK